MTPKPANPRPASAGHHSGRTGHDLSRGAPEDAPAVVDVSVIVVSFNTASLTLECVASVEASAPGPSIETIVVDNASTDRSPDMIAEQFQGTTVIPLERNIGFGAACNLGARRARGRNILLLNPDAKVHPHTIEELLRFSDAQSSARIVGGRTFNEDGTLNPASCWGAPSLWSLFCYATGLTTLFPRSRVFDPTSLGRWDRSTEREVDVVSGCMMLIPRSLWTNLEGFDERFFIYSEDVDLSLRSHAFGGRPRINPNATAIHVGAASEPVKSAKLARVVKAQRQFIRKHWSRPAAMVGLTVQTTGIGLRACAGSIAKLLRGSGASGGAVAWPEVWRRRTEWR